MKYKLTSNTKTIGSATFYQIQALKDFGNVKKGDLGGWIEKEGNLNQDGNAWVSGDAWVFGDAQVSGNAWVSGDARVFGDARVSGNAWVFGEEILPEILSTLPKEVTSITIDGKNYKLKTETKWVLEE